MKIKSLIITSLCSCLALISCDKQLDLEPQDTIIEDEVFKKFKTAESAVSGTYHMLFNANTRDYTLADVTSSTSDHSVAAARNLDLYNNGTILSNDGAVENLYGVYYAAINQSNLLIEKINELGQYDEDQQKQHIGEAKYIRAYAYLRLLSWFGPNALAGDMSGMGIVLYNESYDGFDRDKDIKPRNTIGEVYAQIITDLEECIDALPEPNSVTSVETRVSRANKGSAYALLMRVYLYKQEFALAEQMADKVIGYQSYKLENELIDVFPRNENDEVVSFSTEHIFGYPVSSNNGNWQFGGNGLYYQYNNYWYAPALAEEYAESDLRKILLMRKKNSSKGEVWVIDKFSNLNSRDNLPIIRYPEVLLTKAECLVRNTKQIDSDAVTLLNSIHLRSNKAETPYLVADFSNYTALLDRILLEKKKELSFEGFMRFENLRLGEHIYNADLADDKKVLPIPLREIEISNGMIKQNPGYINQ